MPSSAAGSTATTNSAKKASARPTEARKGNGRKVPAKKSPAGKSPAKRSPTSKTPAKKSPAKKGVSGRRNASSRGSGRSVAPKSPRAAQASPADVSTPAPEPVQVLHADHVVERQWPNAPVRRGLGVALLGLAGADRFTAGESQLPGMGAPLPVQPLFDVGLGVLDVGLEAGERVSATLGRHVNPLLTRAWAPASGPVSGIGATGLRLLAAFTEPLAERGRRLRADSEFEAAAALAAVLPETIQLVMEQLDLTDLAINHVDIAKVLDATADQVDLTTFALENIDLARIIEASLDEVDFTGLAVSRLDFARAVTAALDQVDVVALARDQLDPAKVAAYLRESVDVTETIRNAPGAVAGEAVRGVGRTVGRITGRR